MRFLSKENSDLFIDFFTVFLRIESVDTNLSLVWEEDSGKHFDGGGFTRTVGTDIADDFAFSYL